MSHMERKRIMSQNSNNPQMNNYQSFHSFKNMYRTINEDISDIKRKDQSMYYNIHSIKNKFITCLEDQSPQNTIYCNNHNFSNQSKRLHSQNNYDGNSHNIDNRRPVVKTQINSESREYSNRIKNSNIIGSIYPKDNNTLFQNIERNSTTMIKPANYLISQIHGLKSRLEDRQNQITILKNKQSIEQFNKQRQNNNNKHQNKEYICKQCSNLKIQLTRKQHQYNILTERYLETTSKFENQLKQNINERQQLWKQRISQIEGDNYRLTRDSEGLELTLRELREEHPKLDNQLLQLDKQNSTLRLINNQLINKIQAFEQQAVNHTEKQDKMDKVIMQLRKDKGEQYKQLSTLIQQLQRTIQSSKHQNNQLSNHILSLKQQNQNIKNNILQITSSNLNLHQQQKEEQQNWQISNQNQKLNEQITMIREEMFYKIKQISEQNSILTNQLKNIKLYDSKKSAIIDQLQKQVSQNNNNSTKYSEHIKQLQKIIKQNEQLYQQKIQQNNSYSQQINNLHSKLQAYQIEIDRQRNIQGQERNKLIIDIQYFRNQNNQLKNHLENMTNDHQALIKQNQHYQDIGVSYKKVQKQCEYLHDNIQRVTNQNNQLKTQIQQLVTLTHQLQKMRNYIVKINQENDQFKSQKLQHQKIKIQLTNNLNQKDQIINQQQNSLNIAISQNQTRIKQDYQKISSQNITIKTQNSRIQQIEQLQIQSNKQNQQLKNDIRRIQIDFDRLVNQNRQLFNQTQQNKTVYSECQELRRNNIALNQDKQHLRRQLDNIQGELHRLFNENNSFRGADQEVDRLVGVVNQLESELNCSIQENKKLQNSINQNNSLKAQLNSLQQIAFDYQTSNKKLLLKIKELQQSSLKTEQIRSQLNTRISNIQILNQDRKNLHDQFVQSQQNHQIQLQKYRYIDILAQQNSFNNSNKLNQKRQQVNKLKEENKNINQLLNQETQRLKEVEKSLILQNEENVNMRSNLKDYETQLINKDNQISKLMQINRIISDELTRLKDDECNFQGVVQQRDHLVGQIDQLSFQLYNLKQSNDLMQKSINEGNYFKTELENMQNNNSEMKIRNTQLYIKMQLVQKQNIAAEQSIQQLQKRINNMHLDHKSQNDHFLVVKNQLQSRIKQLNKVQENIKLVISSSNTQRLQTESRLLQLQKYETENAELRNALSSQNAQRVQTESRLLQLQKYETENIELHKNINNYQNKVKEYSIYKHQFPGIITNLQHAQQHILKIEIELRAALKKTKILEQQNMKMINNFAKLSQQHKSTIQQNNRLTKQLSQSQCIIDNQNRNDNEQINKFELLYNDLEIAKQNNVSSIHQNDLLRNKLQNQIKYSTELKDSFDNNLKQLQFKQQQFKNKINSLEIQFQQILQNYDNLSQIEKQYNAILYNLPSIIKQQKQIIYNAILEQYPSKQQIIHKIRGIDEQSPIDPMRFTESSSHNRQKNNPSNQNIINIDRSQNVSDEFNERFIQKGKKPTILHLQYTEDLRKREVQLLEQHIKQQLDKISILEQKLKQINKQDIPNNILNQNKRNIQEEQKYIEVLKQMQIKQQQLYQQFIKLIDKLTILQTQLDSSKKQYKLIENKLEQQIARHHEQTIEYNQKHKSQILQIYIYKERLNKMQQQHKNVENALHNAEQYIADKESEINQWIGICEKLEKQKILQNQQLNQQLTQQMERQKVMSDQIYNLQTKLKIIDQQVISNKQTINKILIQKQNLQQKYQKINLVNQNLSQQLRDFKQQTQDKDKANVIKQEQRWNDYESVIQTNKILSDQMEDIITSLKEYGVDVSSGDYQNLQKLSDFIAYAIQNQKQIGNPDHLDQLGQKLQKNQKTIQKLQKKIKRLQSHIELVEKQKDIMIDENINYQLINRQLQTKLTKVTSCLKQTELQIKNMIKQEEYRLQKQKQKNQNSVKKLCFNKKSSPKQAQSQPQKIDSEQTNQQSQLIQERYQQLLSELVHYQNLNNKLEQQVAKISKQLLNYQQQVAQLQKYIEQQQGDKNGGIYKYIEKFKQYLKISFEQKSSVIQQRQIVIDFLNNLQQKIKDKQIVNQQQISDVPMQSQGEVQDLNKLIQIYHKKSIIRKNNYVYVLEALYKQNQCLKKLLPQDKSIQYNKEISDKITSILKNISQALEKDNMDTIQNWNQNSGFDDLGEDYIVRRNFSYADTPDNSQIGDHIQENTNKKQFLDIILSNYQFNREQIQILKNKIAQLKSKQTKLNEQLLKNKQNELLQILFKEDTPSSQAQISNLFQVIIHNLSPEEVNSIFNTDNNQQILIKIKSELLNNQTSKIRKRYIQAIEQKDKYILQHHTTINKLLEKGESDYSEQFRELVSEQKRKIKQIQSDRYLKDQLLSRKDNGDFNVQ